MTLREHLEAFVCIPKLCNSPDCKWNRMQKVIPPGECAHPDGPQVAESRRRDAQWCTRDDCRDHPKPDPEPSA